MMSLWSMTVSRFLSIAPPAKREALLQKLKLYRLRAKIEIVADEQQAIAVGTQSGGFGSRLTPALPALGLRAIVAARQPARWTWL